MNTLRRAAPWVIPPLLSLAYFWRAWFIWFRIDDFAWLMMPRLVQQPTDLWSALFSPAAQGTVRVFSERLYFLILTGVFGITAWPFRAAAFLTWVAALCLIQAIGARLTGSRAAGFFAALLWAVHGSVTIPLAWASSYNQILIAFVVLLAFYARLRWLESGADHWRLTEAITFLAGFGVLETIVMYPGLVLLHAALDRKARTKWRSALWMLAPAALFTAAHLFLIPKTNDQTYRLVMDAGILATLWRFLEWTLAPWRIIALGPTTQLLGRWLLAAIGVALAAYCAVKVRHRDSRLLIFLGWFLLWIAPVLPLANHISDYYLTVPGIGIAWLAGSAIAQAFRANLMWRAAAAVLMLGYFIGSAKMISTETLWLQNLTGRIRFAARSIEAEAAAHPGSAILLYGFEEEPLLHSLTSSMNVAMGANRLWLPPGEDQIIDRTDLGDLTRYRTTDQAIFTSLEQNQLRVISLRGAQATDITLPYQAAQKVRWSTTEPNFVDVGLPVFASQLGPGWFQIENGARWSGATASLQLDIPSGARTLHITGYAPSAALAGGPVTIEFRAAGRTIGSFSPPNPAQQFEVDFPVPNGITGPTTIELHCSRTFRPPGDGRELGMIFGTFTAR